MKHSLSLFSFFILLSQSVSAANEQRSYDSYNDIVDKLSAQRSQAVSTKMSTTVPHEERFHVSVGLTNTSTNVSYPNIGSINQSGFLIGGSVPLVSNQLFFEGFGKFFKSTEESSTNASLQQYELRLSHKESLTFALLNLGIGTSVRNMNFESAAGNSSLRTPYLLLTSGLERRVSERISLAGDLGFHRSLRDDASGKNVFELALRLNYHL